MILTHLSLQRAPRLHRQMPRAPTNEQRIREFRRVYPQAVGNTFRWPFHGSQSGATSPGPSNPAGCLLSTTRSK